MHPDDTNLFAYNIIDKYENRPDNYIHCTCQILHPVMSAKKQLIYQ